VRIFTKWTCNLVTLQPTECEFYEYTGPIDRLCGGGPSTAERDAQNQAAAESKQLLADFNQQFQGMTDFVDTFLKPQLESLYTNPQGFGARAMADLTSNLVNTVGTQAASERQAENAQFASNNLRGLPSGVQQVVQSQINAGAGNAIAQGSTNIQLANEQYKAQQRTQGLTGLLQLPSIMGSAPQVGGLLTNANRNSFGQAQTINQESMAGDFWGNLGQGLLGGVIGGAADYLTGGLTGMGSLMGGGRGTTTSSSSSGSTVFAPGVL